jgi:hypothetical protein
VSALVFLAGDEPGGGAVEEEAFVPVLQHFAALEAEDPEVWRGGSGRRLREAHGPGVDPVGQDFAEGPSGALGGGEAVPVLSEDADEMAHQSFPAAPLALCASAKLRTLP